MTMIRLRNSRGWAQTDPPRQPDGALYRFELIYDGGKWRGYANTTDDLLDALLPGYTDLDEAARAAARLSHAVQTQVVLQANLVASIGLDGVGEGDTAVLLGARDVPPTPASWSAPVLLVLVTTFYQPIGAHPVPTAEPDALIWLDPSTPGTLLQSLHYAGVVQLHAAAADASDGQAKPDRG